MTPKPSHPEPRPVVRVGLFQGLSVDAETPARPPASGRQQAGVRHDSLA
ncbi:MAG: hypothetical protein QME52_02530 [Bacteroidota bacterium]|nr:hypothetical protein [Bacteroidota bacterium]